MSSPAQQPEASSSTVPQSPPTSTKDEENLFDEKLVATPTSTSLNDPRDAPLLEDFDRYLDAPLDSELLSSSTLAPPTPDSLTQLKLLYPSYNPQVLQSVLSSCDGQLPRVIQLLSGPGAHPSQPTVQVSDADLAAQLQRQERRQQRLRHRRNNALVPVERHVLNDMVATLREIVVPALHAHFAELVFPDFEDTSTGIAYSLEQLEVSALSLPAENIVVRAAPDAHHIRLSVINAFLELEVGRWRYQGTGIFAVRDEGKARITVHGLNVNIRLEPRWSQSGGTRLRIGDCQVTVEGMVRFKTEGAAADWAYNTIAMLFKPLVVSYIKEAVGDVICAALSAHLYDLGSARNLDRASQRPVPIEPSPGTIAPTESHV